MNIVFLGPPGAGKGTMAIKVHEAMHIPHISTGDLFRRNIAEKTPLGQEVKAILESGELVPDGVTVRIVHDRLSESDTEGGFILDGFPRTVYQAERLEHISTVDTVINMKCPENLLIKRLTGRRFCPVCGRSYHIEFIPPKQDNKCDDDGSELSIRKDDTPESVKNRLDVYNKQTAPLIEWYTQRNKISDIDASGLPDKVLSLILSALKQN